MDAQELRNIQEAYMEVVENQQLDEAYKPEGRDKLIKKMGSLGKPDPGSTQKQNQVRADRAKKMYDKNYTSYVRPKSLPDGFGGPEWKSRKNKEKANKPESKKSFPNRLRRAGGQGIRDSYDYYDIILSHLLDEGYAETPEAAEAIMVNMSEDWREDIVEGGFNSSGRYDVGGGRTVGPVAGAVRSLFSGNLPKGRTYVPPSPQKGTNRPPAVPASRDDSGRLTTYGAGGGAAAEARGQTRPEVMQQGAKNLENKKRLQPVNQGPDFGR